MPRFTGRLSRKGPERHFIFRAGKTKNPSKSIRRVYELGRYCYQKASCEPCRTPSSEISAVDVPTKLPTIFGLAPLGGRFLSCPIRAYARARVLGSKLTVTGRSHANRGAMTLVSSGHCYCPLLLLWLDGASGAGTQNHSALITLALR